MPLHRTSQAVGKTIHWKRTERSEREQTACRGFPAAIQRATLAVAARDRCNGTLLCVGC
ncbi:MAG: hypothetical protein LBQ54_03840 [Planctomycetaceae bacterium]|nr:hypothetical protein [Planctomycetaceae bacterium]